MSSPVDVALADLARVLTRLKVDWYLFGAQAAILYGSTRVTEDIDITIALGSLSPREVTATFEKRGFRLRVRDSAGFVDRTRVLPIVHTKSSIPVDVVFAGPGLEEEFMERRREVERGELTLPVVSPEDLVVLKILAARPHDYEDLRAVIRGVGAALDKKRVTDTLTILEHALGQSDLLPAFKKLLRAVGRSAASPMKPRPRPKRSATKRR